MGEVVIREVTPRVDASRPVSHIVNDVWTVRFHADVADAIINYARHEGVSEDTAIREACRAYFVGNAAR